MTQMTDKEHLLSRIHQLEAQKSTLITHREQLIAKKKDLLEASKLALTELDRIGSDIGFEPGRYQERIHALDALSRAVRKAESNV